MLVRYNSVFVPLCSPNTCKDVFNPNVTAFQSNCAEGLHFSAFHSNCKCANQLSEQLFLSNKRDYNMYYSLTFVHSASLWTMHPVTVKWLGIFWCIWKQHRGKIRWSIDCLNKYSTDKVFYYYFYFYFLKATLQWHKVLNASKTAPFPQLHLSLTVEEQKYGKKEDEDRTKRFEKKQKQQVLEYGKYVRIYN